MDRPYETLRLRLEEGVALLSLNRPDARNAVNLQLCDDLLAAEEALARDERVRVVLLRAEGPAFCAGADLKEREGKDAAWVRERRNRAFRAYDAIQQSELPHIAAVNGPLVGSGGEIAMACDFIYASDAASFRFPEALWGTVGATQRLPRRIGQARAKELLLTGRRIDAAEALTIGLVQRLLPRDQIEAEVLAVARAMAKSPPQALRLVKRAVDVGAGLGLTTGIAVERLAIDVGLAGSEWQAGVERFGAAKKL